MERQIARLTWQQVQALVPSKIDTVILPVAAFMIVGIIIERYW